MSKIPFRPSSHSTDVTLVAICRNVRDAKTVEKHLEKFLERVKNNEVATDWNDANIFRERKRVYFSFETNGNDGDIESAIADDPTEHVGVYENYQELTIRFTPPKGLTLRGKLTDALALIIAPEELKLLTWIKENCDRISSSYDEETKSRIFRWQYMGEGIYSEDELSLLDFNLEKMPNWQVEIKF